MFAVILSALHLTGCATVTMAEADYGSFFDGDLRMQAWGYPRDPHTKTDIVFDKLSIFVPRASPFELQMPDGQVLRSHEIDGLALLAQYPQFVTRTTSQVLVYRPPQSGRSSIVFRLGPMGRVVHIDMQACGAPISQAVRPVGGGNWFDVPLTQHQMSMVFGQPSRVITFWAALAWGDDGKDCAW